MYAFDVGSGNHTLGVQPIGTDFTPGDIRLRFENNTGGDIVELQISYNVYVYNDQGRANSYNFSYSADDASYTDVPALDLTSPEAAEWEKVSSLVRGSPLHRHPAS